MLKNYFYLLIASSLFLQSCNDYKKTESGVKYKIINDSAGTNAKPGDLVVMHLKYQNEFDTLDTYKLGHPMSLMLDSNQKGSLEEALQESSKGDSISIQVLNDSLYRNTFKMDSLPKNIKPGTYTTFNIKVVDVYTPSRMKAEEQKYRAQQKERMKKEVGAAIASMEDMKKDMIDSNKKQFDMDEKAIDAYVKKNKLKGQKTANGVFVVITEEGTGEQAAAGDSVSVSYVGKTLDGKIFDQSSPERPNLEYILGIGQLIPGFDEGVVQLKKGSKATFIIPSPLAYGKQGSQRKPGEYIIQPNSVLIFDIQLSNVKRWR